MCPEVTHVLTTIADTGAFDAGCWIAGGFARQVAHHELLQKKTSEQWGNYLKSYQSVPTPDTLRGDVDVFMLHQVTNDKFNFWIMFSGPRASTRYILSLNSLPLAGRVREGEKSNVCRRSPSPNPSHEGRGILSNSLYPLNIYHFFR